jgi:methanogenic corrinoid protein MtbC1
VIRWCSFCQRYLGESPPFDDYSVTHGICKPCSEAFDAGDDFGRAERLVDLFRRLQEAGRGGQIPSASAVLDEGIALGLRPIDLLMGLVQPALYDLGERWAAGETTVANEHAFTAMASALLALVMFKYPEAQAFRQAPRPRILLVAADGNYHTLGVQLVELILMLEHIPTFTVYPGIDASEVVELWRKTRAPTIGFSVGLPAQLAGVRSTVEAIAREPSAVLPRFIVGGFPVRCGLRVHPELHPELPIETLHDPLALAATLADGSARDRR